MNAPIYQTVDGFIPADQRGVFHGFFGNQGGVSGGVYASLNCGVGSNDDPSHIAKNKALVAGAVGVGVDHFCELHQIHSDKCLIVDSVMDGERAQGDAFVTKARGLALGVLTADCAPVLFYGVNGDGAPVIGAAHAGWGGALGGILGSTVEAMTSLGVEPKNIRAAIGPCIAKASYEVGEDFTNPFMDEDDVNERFFVSAQKQGKLMFDLAGYSAFKLSKAGVRHVFINDIDTYANEGQYFSYRRKTHRGEDDYGRQISVICLKE